MRKTLRKYQMLWIRQRVPSLPVSFQIAIPAHELRDDRAVMCFTSSSPSPPQSEYVLSEYEQRSNYRCSLFDSIYDFDVRKAALAYV